MGARGRPKGQKKYAKELRVLQSVWDDWGKEAAKRHLSMGDYLTEETGYGGRLAKGTGMVETKLQRASPPIDPPEKEAPRAVPFVPAYMGAVQEPVKAAMKAWVPLWGFPQEKSSGGEDIDYSTGQ